MSTKNFLTNKLIAGLVMLILSVSGLYATINLVSFLAIHFSAHTFDIPSGRCILFFPHPLMIVFALAIFGDRFNKDYFRNIN